LKEGFYIRKIVIRKSRSAHRNGLRGWLIDLTVASISRMSTENSGSPESGGVATTGVPIRANISEAAGGPKYMPGQPANSIQND
jgi:hypothetical protein